LCRIFNSNPE